MRNIGITISREDVNSSWYRNASSRSVLIHLLLTASVDKENVSGVELERGQTSISVRGISSELGLSFQETRTAISMLKREKMIGVLATHSKSIITILNYDSYIGSEVCYQHSCNIQANTATNTAINTATNTATNTAEKLVTDCYKDSCNDKKTMPNTATNTATNTAINTATNTATKETKNERNKESTKEIKKEINKENNIKEKNINIKRKIFVKPSIAEIEEYANSINFDIDAEYFFAYYESNGWYVGKVKMKNWKSAVVTWKKNQYRNGRNIKNPISSRELAKAERQRQLLESVSSDLFGNAENGNE